jgi:hypothetical protein
MIQILTDFSTPAIAHALKLNLYNLCRGLRDHWEQAVFEEREKQRRWCTPIPMAFIFNAALSMPLPDGDETSHIKETIEFFKSRGQQSMTRRWRHPVFSTIPASRGL